METSYYPNSTIIFKCCTQLGAMQFKRRGWLKDPTVLPWFNSFKIASSTLSEFSKEDLLIVDADTSLPCWYLSLKP